MCLICPTKCIQNILSEFVVYAKMMLWTCAKWCYGCYGCYMVILTVFSICSTSKSKRKIMCVWGGGVQLWHVENVNPCIKFGRCYCLKSFKLLFEMFSLLVSLSQVWYTVTQNDPSPLTTQHGRDAQQYELNQLLATSTASIPQNRM